MTNRAIVVGGSTGGLLAGLLLRRAGWDISIHERSGHDLGRRGAGIVTHDVLHETLAAATGAAVPLGVGVRGRQVLARNGAVVAEMNRPQVFASWDRLWQDLRRAAQGLYHSNSALATLQLGEREVVARFEDGREEWADLLVGADGLQSTVRRHLMPDVQPIYAGYCAWRGLVDGRDLRRDTRRLLGDRFTFCLPAGEQMLGYPVDGRDDLGPEGWRYNWVWYRPVQALDELPGLLTDEDGRLHEGGIAPDRLRPEAVSKMRADAGQILAPALAEVVGRTQRPLLQPIVDLAVPRLVVGRAALLGDAAFVARPHVGMGVTKAAGDAMALSRALSSTGDIDAALASYDAERHSLGQRIVGRARRLGARLQARAVEQAEEDLIRAAQAVMAETATMAGIELW